MKRFAARSLVLVPVLVLGAACRPSVDPTDPLEGTAAALATASCRAAEACLGSVSFAFRGVKDLDTCIREQTKELADNRIARLRRRVEDGRVVYHPDAMDRCVAGAGGDEACLWLAGGPKACAEIFEGRVDAGGSCTLDEECAGAASCDTTNCAQVCTSFVLVPQGGTCGGDARCEQGLLCDDDTGTCVPPLGPGDACELPRDPRCGALACHGGEGATEGTCMALPRDLMVADVGEPCASWTSSAELWCRPGLSCAYDPSLHDTICEAAAASGGPCRPGEPDPCPVGEYCPYDPATREGACTPVPGPGDPCVDDGWNRPCDLDATCDPHTHTCVPLGRLGEACAADGFCYSGSCSDGRCAVHEFCR